MAVKVAETRIGYRYGEKNRVTPEEEIPPEWGYRAPLPGGGSQFLDKRLCYQFVPEEGGGGRYIESGSLASDAGKYGVWNPELRVILLLAYLSEN